MDKVYTQEIVQETPFPDQEIAVDSQSSSVSGGNFTPTTTSEKPIPVKKVAMELLSAAMNTRSRKVLEQFDLEQRGGFQVGNFEEGVAGDLRITPNGIVARSVAGVTTFAINGTDGSAVFAGEVRSGSQVTGSVTIEEGGYILLGNSVFIGDIDSL